MGRGREEERGEERERGRERASEHTCTYQYKISDVVQHCHQMVNNVATTFSLFPAIIGYKNKHLATTLAVIYSQLDSVYCVCVCVCLVCECFCVCVCVFSMFISAFSSCLLSSTTNLDYLCSTVLLVVIKRQRFSGLTPTFKNSFWVGDHTEI